MRAGLPAGVSTAIGSLPHRDADEAVQTTLHELDLPTLPTLPRRSPAEGMIAQALVGLQGITVGQYGSISIDVARVDPLAPVRTDLHHDAFGGMRAFLAAVPGREAPVKWQFVGPVTLGLSLMRAGVPASEAFEVAVRAVRSHVQDIAAHVARQLPHSKQVVFIDEPSLGELMQPGFPLAPDTAIDLVSGALAAVEAFGISGLHVCAEADIASLLATGPAVLSVPVRPSLVDVSGRLGQFLEAGGTVAWGAVPTSGPIPTSAERPWRQLSAVWCSLVERGIDPVLLRTRSVVTPECGLGLHTPAVAARVLRLTAEVGRRVRDQAVASRFVLGA